MYAVRGALAYLLCFGGGQRWNRTTIDPHFRKSWDTSPQLPPVKVTGGRQGSVRSASCAGGIAGDGVVFLLRLYFRYGKEINRRGKKGEIEDEEDEGE